MKIPDLPSFQPAFWLPNAHWQTIFASLLMPVDRPAYRREIIHLPDDDIVAADWVDGSPEQPLLVLIHGMEGDSDSNYARLFMQQCLERDWSGVVLHMRSCGGVLNKHKTFYHAGFYQDIEYFLESYLPQHLPGRSIFLVGVSLGGSQVAHYLAKGQYSRDLKAAALVSTPLDLRASADYMKSGLNRLYVLKFRSSLLKKYHQKADLIRDEAMVTALAASRSFWDLDNAATAPLHGFRDAAGYYAAMSAKNCLQDIVVPALYLASRDDPFIPEESMPGVGRAARSLQVYLTQAGGHVGFVDHYGESWMVPAVFRYFENQ